MESLIAFCENKNCGAIFQASSLINADGNATVTFENVGYGPCPSCGSMGEIPDGVYSFEDVLDDDGYGNNNIKIHVNITIKNDTATIDFSKSDMQVDGSVNAVYAITLSAVLYVFRSLIKEDIPTNAGCQRPIKIITKKGTIVDATFPSAVAGGNVETSQRIVDVVLGALS